MILQIYTSNDEWLRAALDLILSAQDGGERRRSLHLCLSGGTTPKPVYESLARSETFKAIAASKAVHLWVGDEREAPVHSGLRNSEMIAGIFVAAGFKNFAFREPKNSALKIQIPAPPIIKNLDSAAPGLILHAWPTGPRENAAAAYDRELAVFAGETIRADRPFFDLTILGMGEDGHTAGLFSMEDVRRGAGRLVILTEAPQEPKKRMTMAPHVLLSSGKILVLLRGLPKARLLMANLFGERTDPIKYFLLDRCEVVAQI
ncbi:MAG: 6-phosphogluconolactonase [Rectinema sp.]